MGNLQKIGPSPSMSTSVGHHKIYFLTLLFMAILGKLVALAALSALSLFGMHALVTNTNIEVQYIVFCVNLVVLAITAVAFSIFTSIEEKMENLRLKLKLAKVEHNPLKNLVEFMKAREESEVTQNIEVRIEEEKAITEKDTENGPVWPDGISKYGINPRTKKPYKTSPATRQALREKALKREQEKRIQKTAEESRKRKARKWVKA